MSDTPRIDEAEYHPVSDNYTYVVDAEFARTLERELNAVTKHCYQWQCAAIERQAAVDRAEKKHNDIFDLLKQKVLNVKTGQTQTVEELFRDLDKLRTALEEIANECDYYADGAPDATPRDAFANLILGIAKAATGPMICNESYENGHDGSPR